MIARVRLVLGSVLVLMHAAVAGIVVYLALEFLLGNFWFAAAVGLFITLVLLYTAMLEE